MTCRIRENMPLISCKFSRASSNMALLQCSTSSGCDGGGGRNGLWTMSHSSATAGSSAPSAASCQPSAAGSPRKSSAPAACQGSPPPSSPPAADRGTDGSGAPAPDDAAASRIRCVVSVRSSLARAKAHASMAKGLHPSGQSLSSAPIIAWQSIATDRSSKRTARPRSAASASPVEAVPLPVRKEVEGSAGSAAPPPPLPPAAAAAREGKSGSLGAPGAGRGSDAERGSQICEVEPWYEDPCAAGAER
mmetsp:Transcript_26880/g.63806  ORF Transcript_26880/g.63806 Transcript_26880/m.63806 type:complete len:248 (+) Transcript_26880:383-1126(+)